MNLWRDIPSARLTQLLYKLKESSIEKFDTSCFDSNMLRQMSHGHSALDRTMKIKAEIKRDENLLLEEAFIKVKDLWNIDPNKIITICPCLYSDKKSYELFDGDQLFLFLDMGYIPNLNDFIHNISTGLLRIQFEVLQTQQKIKSKIKSNFEFPFKIIFQETQKRAYSNAIFPNQINIRKKSNLFKKYSNLLENMYALKQDWFIAVDLVKRHALETKMRQILTESIYQNYLIDEIGSIIAYHIISSRGPQELRNSTKEDPINFLETYNNETRDIGFLSERTDLWRM
jgi:hypothetical protein